MSKTGLFTFSTMLVVLAYDVAVIAITGTQSSVSQWITDATSISPVTAYGCGALSAHFFGWMMVPRKSK